ncbi:TcpD family membrane protein [Streptococcus danieliae]|uniref:TcpD family membrane protein n=1 Tax=Streptococcus danieliae TaxID=747656 RepID=UPI0026EB3EBF|nr:TcpD family membrane protein [Streptococcus danieliae]
MQSVVEYIIDNFLVWIVVGFAGWKVVESVRDSKIGSAIISAVLGGLAYYFLKNPTQVLEWIGNIWGRMFGG